MKVMNFFRESLCGLNYVFLSRGRNVRGDMEIDEIIKILVILIVLVIAVGGAIYLLKGGGGRLLDSIRDMMRFGG